MQKLSNFINRWKECGEDVNMDRRRNRFTKWKKGSYLGLEYESLEDDLDSLESRESLDLVENLDVDGVDAVDNPELRLGNHKQQNTLLVAIFSK